MTRLVKGILIDPFACTVTEVEHDAESINNIYDLISHETMPVDCFTCAYARALAPGDAIFVDDEGPFKKPDRFFTYPGNPQPLAGKGLLLGSDIDGNTSSALTPIYLARIGVLFFRTTNNVHALEETTEPWCA